MSSIETSSNNGDCCDMFAFFPPLTKNGCILFGKNADKPQGEVQEVVYIPAEEHPKPSKLTCTYIEVDQVERTNAVILSKSAWTWGAGMGSNEHGLTIGQIAVWHKLISVEDHKERLLGEDLVRLALERAVTADEGKQVIIELLEKHGQGGTSSEIQLDLVFNNSFLIIDRTQGWLLETVGSMWVAKKLTTGFIHVTNQYKINTDYDEMSGGEGLIALAREKQLLDEKNGEFDFSHVFAVPKVGAMERLEKIKPLMDQLADRGDVTVQDMLTLLRNEECGIQHSVDNKYPTYGSQVSVLSPKHSNRPCCHWFTGTQTTTFSVYKPFIFCHQNGISPLVRSPIYSPEEDPAKIQPRFQKKVDREHSLFKYHQKALRLMLSDDPKGQELLSTLRMLETRCFEDMEKFLENFDESSAKEAEDLFKDVVESEIKFYKF